MDHGITIGDNTVIGAGSVITRDIPANVVAARCTVQSNQRDYRGR